VRARARRAVLPFNGPSPEEVEAILGGRDIQLAEATMFKLEARTKG
jgi:hypothetical protein